jgi:hypothetical protein
MTGPEQRIGLLALLCAAIIALIFIVAHLHASSILLH